MADPIQIQGSSYEAKVRNPLGVVGLTLVTLGIYGIVWYFKTNKELAEIGKAKGTDEMGTNPTNSLLALIPGAFVIVPPFVSYFNYTKRIAAGERHNGLPEGMAPGLLFLIFIFLSPVALYIAQANINKILEAQAAGGGGGAAPAAPEAAMPGIE